MTERLIRLKDEIKFLSISFLALNFWWTVSVYLYTVDKNLITLLLNKKKLQPLEGTKKVNFFVLRDRELKTCANDSSLQKKNHVLPISKGSEVLYENKFRSLRN